MKQFQKMKQEDIDEITKEQTIAGGKIIIFTKQDDKEYIYGAFETKDSLQVFGAVGGFNNLELVSIEELSLFNKSLICIRGVVGANAPIQHYLTVEDGEITPFLRVATGNTMEVDIDGDGTAEIVSIHGTPLETYIYKWQEGEFWVTSVNKSLGATYVFLNQDRLFEVMFTGSDDIELFEYKSGILYN